MDFNSAFAAIKAPGMTPEVCRRDVWGPAGCDTVPEDLKQPLFEIAVGMGVRAAVKALQYAVGDVADGVLTQRTLRAVQSARVDCLLFRLAAARHVLRQDV